MNLTDFIFETSKSQNEKPALFFKNEVLSYGDLFSLIQKIMGYLQTIPINFQEKIIIMADNSFFFVASYFATIGTGAVAVPLPHQFGKENFEFVAQSCGVRACFVQKKYIKKIKEYASSFEFVFTDDDLENCVNIYKFPQSTGKIIDVDEKEDLAVLIFTSGSTGVPKGVMQTHLNIKANTLSIIEYLNLQPTDRMMVVLPFSYCFGTSLLHTHLRVGGQCVFNNQFMFPGKVLNEINEKQCTGFAGVPSNYQILLRRSPIKSMKFPTLRLCQQAGGKLANTYILELHETLPTTEIFIMYGQTEATARLSHLPPKLLLTKLGSIGKGIPGVTLEVLNKEGNPVKGDEIGEIVAAGENITKGYWQEPAETAKTFRNGKLYTGDLAVVDSDGYLFLVDREKEILKVGGYRVSPKEIEDHIVKNQEVIEAAVIGIEDDLLGEAAKAFVTVKTGSQITPEEIIQFCRVELPDYKTPKVVEFIDEIPKNTSGKIDKVTLRKLNKK